MSQPPRSPWGAWVRARSATVARDRARSRGPSACPAPAPQPRATYSPTGDGPQITASADSSPCHVSRTCLERDSGTWEGVMHGHVESKRPSPLPHRAHSQTSCSRQLADEDPVAPNRRGATELRTEIKQKLGGLINGVDAGLPGGRGGQIPLVLLPGGSSNHTLHL